MSNRALATLGIRLLGVYAWLQVLLVLPVWSSQMTYVEELEVSTLPLVLIGGAALILWTLAGFALIFRSAWFTILILKDMVDSGGEVAGGLQAILFSVVGVVLLASALPRISFLVAQHIVYESEERDFDYLSSRWPEVASLGVLILVGVGLFLGGRGLSRIWRRIGEMNRAP